MSFAREVKLEILQVRRGRAAGKARDFGLTAFAKAFSPDEALLLTESGEIAALYRDVLRRNCPKEAEVCETRRVSRGRELYRVWLPRERDRRALLSRMEDRGVSLSERFASREERAACLAGAFLACGNVSDPEKGYHLEFAVREQPLATELLELLDSVVKGGGATRRRNLEIVYFKECAQVEDLLTLMGASKASLAVVEVELLKEVRNRAMRQTNCETANIDRTVKASSTQVEDIETLLRERGLESLPEPLRQAALLRLENPEMSLRELAEQFEPPISRSGAYHRLDKLSKLAAQARGTEGEGRGA